jgi:hypothetical protein
MQIRERLSLLVLFLALFIVCAFMFRSPDPGRGRIRPEPIEAAFAKIRIGMKEEELVALMAPYQEVDTGHLQWRYWSEGGTVVSVTVWDLHPIGVPGSHPIDGPYFVLNKNIHKKR